jgi:hypothetical protein
MKTLYILLALSGMSLAQGPLQPATTVDPKTGPIAPLTAGGVPQPTMRTLYQVEPRTPLVAGSPGVAVSGGGNITISQSGSYYLTGNLQIASGDAIVFTAGNITLDLSGFTISSTASPAAGYAIRSNLTTGDYAVRNGLISGTGTVDASSGVFSGAGFQYGAYVYSAYHVSITDLHVEGVSDDAIRTDFGNTAVTLVDGCSVRNCGIGIAAGRINNCTAVKIRGAAINGGVVCNSYGSSITGSGIIGLTVNGCFGITTSTSASYAGIYANGGSAINSTGVSGGGSSYSIRATIANSCIATGTTAITNKYNMP